MISTKSIRFKFLVFAFQLAGLTLCGQVARINIDYGVSSSTILDKDIDRLGSVVERIGLSNIDSVIVISSSDTTGSDVFNQLLSEKRTESARNAMTRLLGDGIKCRYTSIGESRHVKVGARRIDGGVRRSEFEIFFDGSSFIYTDDSGPDWEEYSFSNSVGDTVYLTDGGIIFIPKDSFDPKNTNSSDSLVLRFRSYLDFASIMMNGLHTETEDGLLSSMGMYEIYVLSGEDTISKTREGKSLTALLPAMQGPPRPSAYSLYTNNDTTGFWEYKDTLLAVMDTTSYLKCRGYFKNKDTVMNEQDFYYCESLYNTLYPPLSILTEYLGIDELLKGEIEAPNLSHASVYMYISELGLLNSDKLTLLYKNQSKNISVSFPPVDRFATYIFISPLNTCYAVPLAYFENSQILLEIPVFNQYANETYLIFFGTNNSKFFYNIHLVESLNPNQLNELDIQYVTKEQFAKEINTMK